MKYTYKTICKMCKGVGYFKADPKDIYEWKENGMMIQKALPYLNADIRELLISGTCGKCFDDLFGEIEE